MAEPGKRIVEAITYEYPSGNGYKSKTVYVRRNRTRQETLKQIERMSRNYPGVFVDNDRAFSAVLNTFDALGLTGRATRPPEARIVSKKAYKNNRRS